MAQWVLIQREQQLIVKEDVLLHTTRTALGGDTNLLDCYSWTVDFMLRHGLSLQPIASKLPKSIREDSQTFMKWLCLQVCPDHLIRRSLSLTSLSYMFGCDPAPE